MKIKGFEDTIEWYSQNAKEYSRATIAVFSDQIKKELKSFTNSLTKGVKVLDAGFGSGRDSYLLDKEGFQVIGVDLADGLVELAKKTFPTSKFIEGDLRLLPFLSNAFDGVWANASLLHLETPQEVRLVLAEFNRVLKKYGVVHIKVKAKTGRGRTAIVTDLISKHNRFFRYFTKFEIRRLLTQSGFRCLNISKYNESRNNPMGRPEVEWIVVLARKV